MTNINDFNAKLFEISYCEENNTPYVVFNNIECAFRKSGTNSYLVFCETEENKEMLDKYV